MSRHDASPSRDTGDAAGRVSLRILATTDLHAHVYPYDYYADRPMEGAGLARTAALIAAARAETRNTLLLDNGDFLQGTPLGDTVAEAGGMGADAPHPVIAAMNTVGVDAGTLGNHDFNYGLAFLERAVAAARFPLVSANLVRGLGDTPDRDSPLVPPYVILDRTLADAAGRAHPIRIGVIGFAPPQTVLWDAHHLAGRLAARDILDAARAHLPRLRAGGADIVIALCHSGIGPAEPCAGMENAALALAGLGGIDAIVMGHTHQVFPGPGFTPRPGLDAHRGTLCGIPAVMAGAWGGHLGVIDLTLSPGPGPWRVVSHKAETRPIARRRRDGTASALVESDSRILATADAAHRKTLSHVRRPVGRTTGPLQSYFAQAAPSPLIRLINTAQTAHVTRALAGTPHAGLPVLSAAAPYKAGGRGGPEHYTDIPAGTLALRHVADMYPYPNTLRAVCITGAALRTWLERAAGQFNEVTPGLPDQPLLNPRFPSYDFDVIDGVSYRIDLAQPARFAPDGTLRAPGARRITGLSHGGLPVRDDARFVVATNSYRTGTGLPDMAEVILEETTTIRDILAAHIARAGTIAPEAAMTWGFAPLPGTSVLFDTGPGALAHAGDIPGPAAEPLGRTVGGFARFRIALPSR